MKRYIIIALAIISIVVVITSPAVFGAVLLFLFLGIIPGTNIVIPFWVMLPVCLLIAVAALQWLILQPLYIGSIPAQEQTARQLARQRIVPKREPVKTLALRRRFKPAKV